MADPVPNKKEIVGLVEAQAKSIDSISERLSKIEGLVDKQETRNKDIMIAVLVAFILIVGSAAISVITSNKRDNQFYSGLEKDNYEQSLKIQDLSNKIDLIKAKNSYLR